ncbi:MAG: hypothetical protein JW795_08415 [Chitinivibrionales bacterium]|nr:hypothetical protein [Chitinivibrionales bacterium]
MRVKGTAVHSIPEYIKNKFNDRYDSWLQSLPEKSKLIFTQVVLSNGWYDVKDAISIPTKRICDLFFAGDKKGATECGKYSADLGLRGVYKLFIKFGTPNFIIGRGTSVFSTYYEASDLKVVINEAKRAVVHIKKFDDIDEYIELRIGGWIERALELSGAKGLSLTLTQSLTKKQPVTEYDIRWE